MNQHVPRSTLDRRSFLKTAAGLSFVFAVAPDALTAAHDAFADTAHPGMPYTPNVWLAIAPDGTLTGVNDPRRPAGAAVGY